MNTLGKTLRLTTFGESHGAAIGGIIDGFPSCFPLDIKEIQSLLDARRPGRSGLTSSRCESDKVTFLSGISPEGLTLGSPIAFIIRNEDHRPADYESIKNVYRPNHADYTYQVRYGIRDYRGGGRASARETANWVVAGACALQLLAKADITVSASLVSVGESEDRSQFASLISEAKERGDSIGGCVKCIIEGLPAGIGNPVFDKLDASLAYAMLTINGVKGFEIGDGFDMARRFGSEVIDSFTSADTTRCHTSSNHSGGIQGGISNGMAITFNVAFKPTPTLGRDVKTIDAGGNPVNLKTNGRHDPCIALRGVHVVRAMAAFTIADHLLSCGFFPKTMP